MKGPKYIEKKNIPLPLGFKDEPEFLIQKIEREESNVRLYYQVEGRGLSIYVKDHSKFEEIPSKIEVVSGGWYGNKGRWAPLERYTGTILCEDVDEITKISEKGQNFSFKVRKPFFSRKKVLTIESENIGVIEIRCMKIIPQKYEVSLFNKIQDQWVLRNSMSFN
ncbi:MAG: hypothetical protein JJU13_08350 [Balneolaceae bacterium]|nr:hypothetical protein [Balneolaceae bacterium]